MVEKKSELENNLTERETVSTICTQLRREIQANVNKVEQWLVQRISFEQLKAELEGKMAIMKRGILKKSLGPAPSWPQSWGKRRRRLADSGSPAGSLKRRNHCFEDLIEINQSNLLRKELACLC